MAAWLVGISILLAVVFYHGARKHHPKEPPVVVSTIPLLGHLLGMAFKGGKYVKNIGLHNQHIPILTLPVPGSRIYLVIDPSLAAAVQRASKVLSFTPIIPEVTERVLGLDQPTSTIIRRHLEPDTGSEKGFLAEIEELVYLWLGPGDYLNEITASATNAFESEVDAYLRQLRTKPTGGHVADLLEWVRHIVTIGTAFFLYGKQNPIGLEQQLEEAFWDFDHGLGMLLVNLVPSVTARKAYVGRERLARAFTEYLQEGKHTTGSRIIQKRIEIALQHGWTLEMAARSELSFLFAGIVNVTTTTFWMIVNIFSREGLLETTRRELSSCVDILEEDGKTIAAFSIKRLKNDCPVLVTVYKECLRLNSDNNSTRLVKSDMMLADRYFLKKNSVVQIAGGVLHADKAIWGDDVDEFRPERFLSSDDGKSKENSVRAAAFRAFGGGKTICPGRHFAMSEVLGLVALVIWQLDISGMNGERIKVPRKNDGVLPVHILEPVQPVIVNIKPRYEPTRTSTRILL